MRIQQLEERVLRAIETIMEGGTPEDSRIECKLDWPSLDKARQLASHANTARGEPIIWIIGVDEKGRKVVGYNETVEASDWWAQFKKRFDKGEAPDLLQNVIIATDHGPRVMALAFDTDRSPYVINVADIKPEKEIPVRKSNSTHSASRNDLLRLFGPVSRLPSVDIVKASVGASYHVPRTDFDEREYTRFSASITLFFTYSDGAPIFLPQHRMTVILQAISDDDRILLDLTDRPDIYVHDDSKPAPRFGVHRRHDGFGVTGSGRQHLQSGFSTDGDLRPIIEQIASVQLTTQFAIAGQDLHVSATASLHHVIGSGGRTSNGPYLWDLREWRFQLET